MSVGSYAFGVLTALFTLVVVMELLRRRRLRERHAVWWLLAGTLALVIGIFPQTLTWAADLFGVAIPTNLVFFVSIAILFLVCLQHSAELTKFEGRERRLAEVIALQDMRIAALEARFGDEPRSGPEGTARS